MIWENIEINHGKPISSFDVSKDEGMRKAFNWIITQPLIKQVHQHKGINFDFLAYRLQFIKSYKCLKLNEEGLD